MRPTHKNRNRSRQRSSGGGSSGGGNPLSRVYESNGPDMKVRGTAQTVADKYLQLGRDAQSAGDIVMAESYFQYAEHYLRIVSAAQAYNQQSQQQHRRPDEEFDDEDLEDGPESSFDQRGGGQGQGDLDGMGDQPAMEAGERPQQQQPQHNNRQQRDNRDPGQYQNRNDQNRNDQNRNDPNRDQNRNDQNRTDQNRSDQNRDQNGQSYQPRDQQRYKPRWQDRRPDNPQQGGGERQPYQQQPQPRSEEQPRPVEAAPQPQPQPQPAAPAEAGKWEAPSFLRRPASIVPERAPASAPEAAPAVASDVQPAPAAPAKRKYERRPRKDAAPAAADAGAEPPAKEPVAD